jgi:hypothetical protein
MQKMFNKKLIYLFATVFAIVFVPNISKAAVLLPGNISSCGELTSPGHIHLHKVLPVEQKPVSILVLTTSQLTVVALQFQVQDLLL